MAHISAGALDVVAPLTATDNVGAVVASRSAATARRALKRLRKENQRAAILLDAAQYTGNSRRVGATGMSEQWVNDQFAAGLTWAMTDSGYIPKGDGESLKSVLGWGTHSDRLLVCLPLATDWLTANLDTLIEVITATGRPVALVLESESDPLRHKETVAGLIEVLRCDVPTLLLRSDTSVLGALAHGAAAVSVGVRSGLRHLYPATDGDDEVFTPPPSVYVPAAVVLHARQGRRWHHHQSAIACLEVLMQRVPWALSGVALRPERRRQRGHGTLAGSTSTDRQAAA